MIYLESIKIANIETKNLENIKAVSIEAKSTETKKIESDIHRIIAELLSVDATLITNNACLREDLGADSLDLAELINALASKYKRTEIYDMKVQEIRTVGEIAAYINKNQH